MCRVGGSTTPPEAHSTVPRFQPQGKRTTTDPLRVSPCPQRKNFRHPPAFAINQEASVNSRLQHVRPVPAESMTT